MDDDFYAIDVLPEHGGWETTDILESLHRNWPHVLQPYIIRGVIEGNLTVRERRNLRNANVQAFTSVSDGTVYMPLGLGVVCSGVSFIAVRRAAEVWDDVRRLQLAVEEQMGAFIIHLQRRGYTDQGSVTANLVGVQRDGYQIHFPDYGFQANVPLFVKT
jgi:hypothetical protein